MASSSNGNGNIVDEFEEAFQVCLQALTKQESSSGIDKDEVNLEVDQTTMKFIDLARQMEAFFLQKRFLLSSLKPELRIQEDNQDLRLEITRKDEMIRRHYEKIENWKGLLADQSNYKQNPQQPSGGVPLQPHDIRGPVLNPGMQPNPGMGMGVGVPGPMGNPTQAQMQAQHLQHQQQFTLAQQQIQQMQQMQVGGQQMFMPGAAVGGGRGNVVPTSGGFNQGSNILQGPLAYLEKTTSNIDLVGMGDGRR